jgi:hypothetical protein
MRALKKAAAPLLGQAMKLATLLSPRGWRRGR